MAASLGNADTRNNSATTRTRLAGAPEYIEFLRVSPCPVSRKIKVGLARTQGGAQVLQSFFQDLRDAPMQGTDLAPGERMADALRVNAGFPEGFIDIDVAQAGQKSLVQQQRFDLALPAL